MSAPRSFELQRTGWMRFGGGPWLQPAYVLAFVVWTLFAIRNGEPVFLIISAVALLLWLFGALAYTRVDDDGIHRRCYVTHHYAWGEIRGIELVTRSFGYNSARRLIRVRREHGRNWLTPASGNTRYTEQFARELLAAARARGVDVTTSGWGGFDE